MFSNDTVVITNQLALCALTEAMGPATAPAVVDAPILGRSVSRAEAAVDTWLLCQIQKTQIFRPKQTN